MSTLGDLFDRGLFDTMVDGGYVRVQQHPTLPLHIANYSEKAQYENVWNDVTLTCRGLIYDATGKVHARPYRKFFNYGDDVNTGPLDLHAPAIVTDKLDGSLGISYMTPDGPAIATRGSFASDQALHATEVLRSRYPDWTPAEGWTYLFEIVYPQNRIVVDYGELDDLILHGIVAVDTGAVHSALDVDNWPGPVVKAFAYESLAEALAADPRPNAEGLVVALNGDTMVKVKQADYVALHRIITGLNARTVWEWLGDGKTIGDLCATIPDDFHGWVEDVANGLTTESEAIIAAAEAEHTRITGELPADFGRGDYARHAVKSDLRSYLFLLLDDKRRQARELAWRAVKPSGAWSMVNHSEAVA